MTSIMFSIIILVNYTLRTDGKWWLIYKQLDEELCRLYKFEKLVFVACDIRFTPNKYNNMQFKVSVYNYYWPGLDRMGRSVQNRSACEQKKTNGRFKLGLVGRRIDWFGLDWVYPVEFGFENPTRWITEPVRSVAVQLD